ncbi:MAG: DNA repair protein RecN [Actinomycetota bacterium]|nr:DNA repair protein RecN [Actinomycetota bacterium]
MLRELHISGLGVIDDLDLELDPGLNVLTGETGAGKTMITVGLSLALGARAAATVVRPGTAAARVQARFDVPDAEHDAAEWAEDGELVLARTVSADGRGSARIGGQLATASALTRVGTVLVELHGQHQAQRLLSTTAQTEFLDRFAGDDHLEALRSYRDSFHRLRIARAAHEELSTASRERERELDLLGYQVREIESVAPRVGETDELVGEEARLSHVERLLETARRAEEALAGEDGGGDALGSAAASLGEAAGLDSAAGGLADHASSIAAETAELARDIRIYRERLSVDPGRLQEMRERIGALRDLQRKYGETDRDVMSYLAAASERLAALTGADDRLEALAAEVAELQTLATDRAGAVTAGRSAAAPTLAGAIAGELDELGMPGARIQVGLEPAPELTAAGAERAELRFAAVPGHEPLPLAKTASGGELSRTMLACRSVLADLDEIPTLVFDEVDAGIGGQAGLAVGRRLARLALGRQVLVVTHLPQIACFADRHVRVRKHAGTASIHVLDDAGRVRELSRMLAGLEKSESAVSHAEELLTEAARTKAG